jgi:hypothetical protein
MVHRARHPVVVEEDVQDEEKDQENQEDLDVINK